MNNIELNGYEWGLIEDALEFAASAKDNFELEQLYWKVQRARVAQEDSSWNKEAFNRYGD